MSQQQPPRAPETPPVDEPRFSLGKRRRTTDAEMDITPLIDIVFLLLIFFLVASKMDESAAVRLPPARHGEPVSEDSSIVVLIRKGTGDQITVARRDGTPFAADPQQQEEELARYVEAGMAGSDPFDRPLSQIMIKAERDIQEGDVNRVAEAIGRVAETPLLDYAVLESQ